ncbi:MAG: acyl-CoA dehydratase activase [Candidatus Cloacimonadaceae bacterium]
MSFVLGIDIGSRNTKLVFLDMETGQIAFSSFADSGINPVQTVQTIYNKGLASLQCPAENVLYTCITGYGRNLMKADKVVSEITCHTLGVQFYQPDVRTIIDIGGQDSKIISLDEHNHIRDFVMNDKCAAGTGRFLEMVAMKLGITCDNLDKTAAESTQDFHLSSTCVVFAESEIIGLIAQGVSAADIARSVHLSISDRIVSQLNQLAWQPPIVFTGGVALNHDLKNIFSQALNTEIIIPPEPELTGALGAALTALRELQK